jgi:threonine/homoserine/homoserine lactone efflux protein
MMMFALAALVLVMLPGPDQALITRNALVGGRSAGLATMLGGALGLSVHASGAALGLSALLMASATAFTTLKIAGAVYLLWLGAQLLWSARHAPHPTVPGMPDEQPRQEAFLRQGFLSNVLNPKVALFFVTFLPQFFEAGHGSPRVQALCLSAIFAGLYVAWFGLYVAAVHRLGRWLRRPRVKTRIEQVTGLVLASVAVRLAIASR